MKPAAVLLIALFSLTGCVQRYFYNKPEATYGEFRTDHYDCLRSTGIPTGRSTHVLVSSDLYRLCMKEHGWTRAKQTLPPPTGWYRGQEKEEVIAVDSEPPAVPRSALSEGSRNPAHCRQIHLAGRSDWRDHMDRYRACLDGR